MTSIKLRCLRRTRCTLDGPYPTAIQIIRHRQKREIVLPFYLYPEEIDSQTGLVVHLGHLGRSRQAVDEINRSLTSLYAELIGIVESLLADKGESCSAADIAGAYRTRHDRNRFFMYADAQIAALNNKKHFSTANNYRSACNSFLKFLGENTLTFDELTPELIERFVTDRNAHGNHENTVTFYLRQLRAIYNKAVKERVVKENLAPFRYQPMRQTPTRKRALTLAELRKVNDPPAKALPKRFHKVRDLFMASVHLHGMAFVDMCYLKRSDIEGEYIRYARRKTGQELLIHIEQPLQVLLDRFADPDSPYLFPMLRGSKDEHRSYRNALNRLGKRIRQFGEYLHLAFPLTFYVARHTWATVAYHSGVEMSVISSSLGHTSEKTTRIYLAEMDVKKIDSGHRAVINALNMSTV